MKGGQIEMSGLDGEPGPSRRLWIVAAIGALALHIGGAALAVAHMRTVDPEDSLGTAAIEIGLETMSPRLEATDLPPGPDTEASVASPAIAEQKAELKETELPKDVPTEANEPDRVVSPNDSNKPKENDTKVATVQTSASLESEAAEASARQTLDDSAPKADVASAPNLGLGKDNQRLKAKWELELSGYIKLHMRYPKVQKDKAAIVTVSLVINRQGKVLSAGIFQSSGDPVFDGAAISTIRRSDPLPPPPSELTDEQFSYVLPMSFTDRK
jgi:periplasmic protein TonB